jgi:hypothetical protein
MNRSAFLLGLGCVLFLSSCYGGGADKRITDLETRLTATQDQNRDLRAKMSAAQSFAVRSPLAEFFAADDFWQCTYNSSWSDCSSRCAKAAALHRHQCAAMTDDAKRGKCYIEASDNAAHCVQNCPVQMSPTSLPNCRGSIQQ